MTQEQASNAVVAARIVAGLAPKTVSEALEMWDEVFAHISNRTLHNENNNVTPVTSHPHSVQVGTTSGGRKMPIVNQSEIQSKINSAKVIPVSRARSLGVPEDAVTWAEKRGIEFLVDNREAQKENPKRPSFVGSKEDGSHVKTEDGKSMSFWGSDSWKGNQKYES